MTTVIGARARHWHDFVVGESLQTRRSHDRERRGRVVRWPAGTDSADDRRLGETRGGPDLVLRLRDRYGMTELVRLPARVYRLIKRGNEGDGASAGSQAVASGAPASSAP